jgi:hypothetical protein
MMKYLKDDVDLTTSKSSSSSKSSSTLCDDKSPASILKDGEVCVWTKSVYQGFWRKTMIKTWVITNQRILLWSNIGCYVMEELALENITDVLVVNQQHQSNTNFNMYSTGMKHSRYMSGSSRSMSQAVWDILILHDGGVPFSSLCGINDPVGLVNLIKSLVHNGCQSFDR